VSRTAPVVSLSQENRSTLQATVRVSTAAARDVFRARIVLLAAKGMRNDAIGATLGSRQATVSQWRSRFVAQGMAGLTDRPRQGHPPVDTEETECRILVQLDARPPSGYALWNGRLLAEALGDVSDDHVWRVLRKHGISIERRRSWCESTAPEFASKAADIVRLYMNPPENALVVCVDERPWIQALERAQGYLKLPSGRALMGFSHDYIRHGTTTLCAALEVATGLLMAGQYKRWRRREFLDFMNEVVAANVGREIHVVVDNLNTHKPKNDRRLRRHKNVLFHYTPTHASWMNMVEVWFSILSRGAVRRSDFHLGRASVPCDRRLHRCNPTAPRCEWTKKEVEPKGFRNTFGNEC